MPKSIEIFVCTNVDCKSRGAEAVLKALRARLESTNVDPVAVKPYLCFSACNSGPNVVIPSRRCWFSGVHITDVPEIVEFLNGGPNIVRLNKDNDPELQEMIFAIIDAGLVPEDS
jgi:NADH:ubiquinone oxidoreductase subunit E